MFIPIKRLVDAWLVCSSRIQSMTRPNPSSLDVFFKEYIAGNKYPCNASGMRPGHKMEILCTWWNVRCLKCGMCMCSYFFSKSNAFFST